MLPRGWMRMMRRMMRDRVREKTRKSQQDVGLWG